MRPSVPLILSLLGLGLWLLRGPLLGTSEQASYKAAGWLPNVCDTPVANAIKLNNLVKKDSLWSRCAGLTPLIDMMSAAGPLVYVDIGCGVGYSLAHVLGSSSRSVRFNPANLSAELTKSGLETCGVCGDCKVPPPQQTKPVDIEAYCINAFPQNYRVMLKARDNLLLNEDQNDSHVQLSVLHYVVGNGSLPSVAVPSSCVGEECSAQQAMPAWEKPVDVATISLDSLAKIALIKRISILNIQAQGSGPAVIAGAEGLLRAKSVDTLLLTYSQTGQWLEPAALKRTLDKLQGFGYSCFWAGKDGFMPATGCYIETMDRLPSARLACAPASSPYYLKLASLISR